jgi:hypothetical protein
MGDKLLLNFYKFKDELPSKNKEILYISKSTITKKYECSIILFTENVKYKEYDFWCYTSDIIKTVVFENRVDELLYSLADNKNIPIEVKVEQKDNSLSEWLHKRIYFYNN